MPELRPFRGVLYNPHKIKDLSKVVTEPYDVISPAQQSLYHRRHPYNIIRLILGENKASDNNRNNRYTRAKKFFLDWQKKGILLSDDKEGIYIYSQSFLHNGKRRIRTGFIALLKLEDFAKNTVLPHENTFSQPVQDRLKLLRAVGANLSPIFAMFCDSQGKINQLLSQHKAAHRPYIVFQKDSISHRLWRMSGQRSIKAIKNLLKDQQIFIADGHHRYEAALNYKIEMQKTKKRADKEAPYNYVMTYLVSTANPGLTILPTHRLVKGVVDFKTEKVIGRLKKIFQVKKFSTPEGLFSFLADNKARHTFGSCFGKNIFYALRLKGETDVCKFIGKDRLKLNKDLDVTILHSVLIEKVLQMQPFGEHLYYTRDAHEAVKLVGGRKYQAAFFLKPATITQVKRMAKSGERMPQKSTYFYPKLLTGLVLNAF